MAWEEFSLPLSSASNRTRLLVTVAGNCNGGNRRRSTVVPASIETPPRADLGLSHHASCPHRKDGPSKTAGSGPATRAALRIRGEREAHFSRLSREARHANGPGSRLTHALVCLPPPPNRGLRACQSCGLPTAYSPRHENRDSRCWAVEHRRDALCIEALQSHALMLVPTEELPR